MRSQGLVMLRFYKFLEGFGDDRAQNQGFLGGFGDQA